MVTMPHWPTPLWRHHIDLKRERIQELLSKIGNPHHQLPPIIHLAGTNGKGSTVAFLRAILQAAGYRVHSYTSPHLVEFNERISIDGNPIADDLLYKCLETCRHTAERDDIPLTFFEGTTAAAFVAFSRVPADVVLLETGLGGRLDATNIIPNPHLTIITPISYDHMEFLGNDILSIANEKAGILKPHVPCVIAHQLPEVMDFLCDRAAELEVPTLAHGYDWGVQKEETTEADLIYMIQDRTYRFPAPSLSGDHQYMNAATAMTATFLLKGFTIKETDLAKGLKDVSWPGRLQPLDPGPLTSPLSEEWQIWLDGAHNNAAAHMLSLWMETQKDIPIYMVLGMTRGRNVTEFLTLLQDKIDHIVGVTVHNEPSSLTGEAIANGAADMGIPSHDCETLEEAIASLKDKEPGVILICGSLYLVGEALSKNKA